MENLFSQFAPVLRDVSDTELAAETASPQRLLIDSAPHGQKRLDVAYAPFDHVNMAADIVIVGLTPGRQQMRNALMEARRLLRQGRSEAEAMEAAKVFASFSGPMRAKLVAMLDSIGVNRLLGLQSTGSLWNGDARRVHFTSALRYPVFVDGANYSGMPSILSTPLLRAHLMKWFAMEMHSLPNAIFVPLGPKVAEAVEVVAQERGVDQERVLAGLPHPSGANAERIAFFLGRKDRADLSAKVVPERLLAARAALETKIGILVD
ncbi:MAG: hypothetical protein GEU89_14825 [Kiloniellaceae bacterium]|nr:hypothetical protein [Kiloniellaceae bacterium]